MIKRLLAFLLLLVNTLAVFAQETAGNIEMADAIRSNGKIYVVVIVLSIVFAGLVVFLVVLDRKVKKLEKQMDELK